MTESSPPGQLVETTMQDAGISLWRRVGETLVQEIDRGLLAPGDKLPGELALVSRFGVARQTIRRALAHLKAEGLIRIEHGRGAFVTDKALNYRMNARSFFEENLRENSRFPSRALVSAGKVPASLLVATALGIAPQAAIFLSVMVGKADGVPIGLGRNHFSLARLPDIHATFHDWVSETFSVTTMLKSVHGIDLRRKTVRLSARPPSEEEARLLDIPASEYVMEAEVLHVDQSGAPVFFSTMAYCSSRVRFTLDDSMFG